MQTNNYVIGPITIGGAIGFILIVIYLHIVQQNYDPVHQLMSELALGRHGSLMILAFFGFALSVFTAQIGLHQCQSPIIIRLFLIIAAISLLGAGVFDLGSATVLHIALVAVAFFLIVLVMYLVPMGIGQRAAALCILIWLVWIGYSLVRLRGHSHNSP